MSEERGPAVTIIKPSTGWGALGLGEVWEYRELLFFFLWREIRATYRQMAFGPLWMILKPIVGMIVFTLIFGNLAKIPTNDLPKPLFYYAGLLPWYLFATAVSGASNSLVGNMHLISKVYFPRLIAPIYASLTGILDFAISCLILCVLAIALGHAPRATVILAPGFAALGLLTALAIGLWVSALAVKFRDVGYAMGFVVQLWMFASPVVYPLSQVPERWRTLYQLNPMAGAVEGFRWAFFGAPSAEPPGVMLLVSTLIVGVALIGGAYHFRRTERSIVDSM